MKGFLIFQDFEQVSAYATVAQGFEYASIRLNNALCQSSEYAW